MTGCLVHKGENKVRSMVLSKDMSVTSWSWKYFLFAVLLGGMRSLTRLLLVICWFACAVLLANFLGKSWGIIGYCVGFSVGFVVSSILTWAALLGYVLLFLPFPPCQAGKCRSIDDYEWNVAAIFGRYKWGVYRYTCRCGDKYVRDGKRFMKLLPDGETRPYKMLAGFREWSDEMENPSSPN